MNTTKQPTTLATSVTVGYKGQSINTYSYRDYICEIVGYWNEDSQSYDYYDVFIDGECVNLGDPMYTEYDAYMYMIQAGHDQYCEDNPEVN